VRAGGLQGLSGLAVPSAGERTPTPSSRGRVTSQLGGGSKCRASVNWIATRFFHKTFPPSS
jgi:hypothetical protein